MSISLSRIVKYNRLDVLRHYNVDVRNRRIISKLCFSTTEDRLPLLQWLHDNGALCAYNTIDLFMSHGDISVPQLQWLLKHYELLHPPDDTEQLLQNCRGSRDKMMVLIDHYKLVVTPKTIAKVTRRFPSKLTGWALELGVTPNKLLNGATELQKFELEKWFSENGVTVKRRKKK